MMRSKRYWGLFWIAMVLALHALVVGNALGSSFFVLMFFWGWVAVHALRGSLEQAQAMVIIMCVLLFSVVGLLIAYPHAFDHEMVYYSLALYPAMVSWVSAYFYIRHLMSKRYQPTAADIAREIGRRRVDTAPRMT